MPTVLVIEDNAGLREMVRDYLAGHGLSVQEARDGDAGLAAVRRSPPDLVILDLMMPGLDGLGFLRAYREAHAAPVIILTARDRESEKIAGLEAGADDYVTKPFSVAELLARVRAHLRRAGQPPSPVLRRGPFTLDLAAHTVRRSGQAVELTPSEFELLSALVRSPQRVFSRLELLEVLQDDLRGSERTIDVHIRNLRVKLEPDPARPRWLETVFGLGYRFNPQDQA